MTYKQLKLISFLLSTSFTGLSQQTVNQHSFCSHDEDNYQRAKVDPEFAKELDSINNIQEQHLANYKANANRSGTIYYIPVVYHVVHEGGVENISREQILSDLEDLNDSYRKRNSNVGAVNPAFLGITADVEIEFRLAQKKNDGTCFSGITRTFSSATNGGGNSAVDAVKIAHGDFPGNKYMNIYIAKTITSGAAGYTYRPGPPFYADMKNGIHVLHTYVGNIGTSVQPGYNTTIAHEAGHWLNLSHLWGGSNTPGLASNCSIDDGVGDTPNTTGWTSCNVAGVTCGTLDNVENIMEYSYCSKMFTNGQKTRMRAAITSVIGGRSNLITAANHTATGIFDDVLCNADFTTESQSVCQYESIQYFDASYHNATSWSWKFDGGTPSTSNLENPTVTYSNPGRHNVSLTVTNASGTKSVTKSRYIRVLPSWGASLPYSEGFEISDFQFEDTWETISNDPSAWGLSNSSFSGSKSAMLRNFNLSPGIISELSSRTLNLTSSASASLNFRYSYARKSSTASETVQVLISRDCGETWVIVRGLNPTVATTNSEFFPSNGGDWSNQTISIGSFYYTSNFRFKILVKNGDGNNFFIDDININQVVGIDEKDLISNVELFPNPTTSSTTASIELTQESEVSVSLLNTLGQTVKNVVSNKTLSQGINKLTFERDNLKAGIYFVSIEINGIRRLEKLIIQ